MVKVGSVTDELMGKVDLSHLKPNRPEFSEKGSLEILAGPILRYWGLDSDSSGTPNSIWRGSISYITGDSNSDYESFPELLLGQTSLGNQPRKYATYYGISFWRYDFSLPTHATESVKVSYRLGEEHPIYSFWIPAQNETMRTMFYSCNGFSLGVDPAKFPACLWDDVLRKHEDAPFHVMLGGGDQLYCDSISLVLPDNALNSHGTFEDEAKLRTLVDKFYLHQYTEWYGRGYWKGKVGETIQASWVDALATIPSLCIYDDHDIIDGFGTYHDATMESPIFSIIGEYAHLYYMLFQQNVARSGDSKLDDTAWICTGEPGPFIKQPARSLFARLGKTVSFLGLDCRTERKKNQVCSRDHYELALERVRAEVSKNPEIKHLYLMLGVPIAYPRMVWAENIMSSKLITPMKWLSKKKIILQGLVNPFDGDVELLDDLNDHWCAKHHKRERNWFLHQLIHLQKDLAVRVTILTGDVHLGALGVFASLLKKEPEYDDHFMLCPVSSAIVNTPPPPSLADFLHKRNKRHILGAHVLETMLPIFDVDTEGNPIGANKTLMAKRNYCILDPILPESEIGKVRYPGPAFENSGHHKTKPAKHNRAVKAVAGSIRMRLQIEKNTTDESGTTVPYETYIPTLLTKKD